MDADDYPGYEFEAPGPRFAMPSEPESLRALRRVPPPAPAPWSPVAAAGSGVFAAMRARNWLFTLAVPLLVAVVVGVSAVVIVGGGGNGGAAPSSLAAGFPPARVAGPPFTGATLTAISGAAATQVATGSANGAPALWTSADGGAAWTRDALTTAGPGQLSGAARGPAGWVAVGASSGPLVVTSADAAEKWTRAEAGLATGAVAVTAVTAGTDGYVIIGQQDGAATAWFSADPGRTGWQRAAITGSAAQLTAVTAVAGGFVAVGTAGGSLSAWVSADGRAWHQVALPGPAGATRATLSYVAASGAEVVAAGTEFSAAGTGTPFAEVSSNPGRSWTAVDLPAPASANATTTVTALTAAGGGFTAAGTYGTTAGPEVALWTLGSAAQASVATDWTAAAPQGTGLASASTENTITGLTVSGATLSGVGFTAAQGGGTPRPTLWQSPIRS